VLDGILYAVTGLYWLTSFILTHLPAQRVPRMMSNDKLEHFTGYFILCALLCTCIWSARPAWTATRMALVGVLICAIYGVVDELTQLLPMVNRRCDVLDWVFDMLGAGAAASFVWLIRRLGESGRIRL
jgi:VanZ family protein